MRPSVDRTGVGITTWNREGVAGAPPPSAAEVGREVVERTSDAVITCTEFGRVLFLNPAAQRMAGVGPDEPVAELMTHRLFAHWADELLRDEAMPESVRRGTWEGELAVSRSNGEEIPVSVVLTAHGEPEATGIRFTVWCRDLSDRLAHEAEMARRAMFDTATGLPARSLFVDRLNGALREGGRTQRSVTVLVIGVDRIGLVAQSLGHDAVDLLTAAAADRLHGVLRDGDGLASLGRAVFAVMCRGTSPSEARRLGERLREAMARPFLLQGRTVSVTASVGVAAAGQGGEDRPEGLLRDADAARQIAEERGGDTIDVFDRVKRARAVERLEIESALRHALEREEFVLYYQPKVNLLTGEVESLEALLRWRHPTRGLVPPGSFIPVAEDTGLISPIGAWAMRAAMAQSVAWAAVRPERPVKISVNVSPRQLMARDYLDHLAGALDETGADPADVVIEITESVVAERIGTAMRALDGVRELGLGLAIDDFGSGYSSLAYLKRFSADYLKLDRSFVIDLDRDQNDWEIVNAVIGLAHAMGMRVVAEGVETAAHAGALRILGADLAQGYFYARPAPAGEAAAFLEW